MIIRFVMSSLLLRTVGGEGNGSKRETDERGEVTVKTSQLILLKFGSVMIVIFQNY